MLAAEFGLCARVLTATSKQQCNERMFKNRELFYCDRIAGRMQGDYFSRLRTRACLCALSGFTWLLETF